MHVVQLKHISFKLHVTYRLTTTTSSITAAPVSKALQQGPVRATWTELIYNVLLTHSLAEARTWSSPLCCCSQLGLEHQPPSPVPAGKQGLGTKRKQGQTACPQLPGSKHSPAAGMVHTLPRGKSLQCCKRWACLQDRRAACAVQYRHGIIHAACMLQYADAPSASS